MAVDALNPPLTQSKRLCSCHHPAAADNQLVPALTSCRAIGCGIVDANNQKQLSTTLFNQPPLGHQQDSSDFPTDVDFKWAQDSYNVTQRNIDTWLFFGVFRARLWLLDQKWSYAGGFTGVILDI